MHPTPDRPRWWTPLLTALVGLLLAYSWTYLDVGAPNERSRIYLAVAMVDHGTLSIDEPMRRFGHMMDLARFEGRFYSDKAPGSSVLGAALYWTVRRFSEPGDWDIFALMQLMRHGLMVPLSGLGFLALRRLLRDELGLDAATCDLASLGWILATAAFHYGSAYYGHQIVAVALICALYTALRARRLAASNRRAPATAAWAGAAGVAAGLAGLTEYQAGIPCALLALWLAWALRQHPLALLAFGAGALPSLLGLLAYQNAAFGGPLELSYHHLALEQMQQRHTQGVGGVTLPAWEFFHGGVLSLHRGLVPNAPWLLLGVPGLWEAWRRGHRGLALLLGTSSGLFVLFVSSSNTWFAGWSFGPRLLVPILGWMAVLAALGLEALRGRWWAEGLARGALVWGLLYNAAMAATFAEPPPEATHPAVDVARTMWDAGRVAPNLASRALDLRGPASVLPLALLTGLALGLLVFLGLERMRRGQRLATATLAIVVGVGGLIGLLILVEPSWDAVSMDRWLGHVERWERNEWRYWERRAERP